MISADLSKLKSTGCLKEEFLQGSCRNWIWVCLNSAGTGFSHNHHFDYSATVMQISLCVFLSPAVTVLGLRLSLAVHTKVRQVRMSLHRSGSEELEKSLTLP